MRIAVFLIFAFLLSVPAASQACGSGTTTTHYQGGLGGHGAFFDIVVGAADMTIECVDISAISSTGSMDVEFYWCPTTSFGNETNAAAWTLFASVAGVTVAGAGLATPVDLSGNGQVFAAGQNYGLLVVNSVGQIIEYTPATSTTFTGTHCDVVSNGGSFYPFSFYWADRVWNGSLHTELAAPAGPTLALTGSCPGPATLTASNLTPGGTAYFAYSFGQGPWAIAGGPVCVGTVLPLIQPTVLGATTADAVGAASLAGAIPAAACATVSVIAFDAASCTATNALLL